MHLPKIRNAVSRHDLQRHSLLRVRVDSAKKVELLIEPIQYLLGGSKFLRRKPYYLRFTTGGIFSAKVFKNPVTRHLAMSRAIELKFYIQMLTLV